jgi:hypothetical protein
MKRNAHSLRPSQWARQTTEQMKCFGKIANP